VEFFSAGLLEPDLGPNALAAAGCGGSLGGSFGALRTFQAGLAFGALDPREAVKFKVFSSKNMSKLMFGIAAQAKLA